MKRNFFRITLILLMMFNMMVSAAFAAEITDSRLVRPESLVPMGQTAGVQFTSKGLMVVGYAEIPGIDGTPAQKSGLQIGDFITHIENRQITGAKAFHEQIQNNGGQTMSLKIVRRGSVAEVTLKPEKSVQDNEYRIGVWVRDNVSGIGTLTFYDPSSGMFGALGHGINDTASKMLLPIANGSLLSTQVVDVRRGQAGQPGELKGAFDQHSAPGSLLVNASSGLFGILDKPESFELRQAIPTATQKEVHTGKATMLSNVCDQTVGQYDIEIVKIFDEANQQKTRNFLIRVTDQALIEKTGGIVQGMSGSPIIQDGKIVGAVTHVLVSDPKRGYGIFIDNMLSEIYKSAPAVSLAPPTAA